MIRKSAIAAALVILVSGQEPSFRTGTDVVLVPAIVRDARDASVPGLGREDFQLLEDGKRRPILYVDVETRDARRESSIPDRFDAYVFDDLLLDFRDFERAREAFERHLAETSLDGRRSRSLPHRVALRFLSPTRGPRY